MTQPGYSLVWSDGALSSFSLPHRALGWETTIFDFTSDWVGGDGRERGGFGMDRYGVRGWSGGEIWLGWFGMYVCMHVCRRPDLLGFLARWMQLDCELT